MDNKTKWVCETAVMLALLIALQVATKAMGQIVTGSCVNFILVMTMLLCGLSSSVVVALLSPIFAFLLGIGPAFIPLVPCIMAGNLTIVLVTALLKKRILDEKSGTVTELLCVWAGAVLKFIVLFVLVVMIVLPGLGLPEAKVSVLASSFTWPQLVTALIGGSVAAIAGPLVNHAKNN